MRSSPTVRSATQQIRLGLPADRKAAPVEQYAAPSVDDLKAKFAKVHAFVTARGGAWVTSIPGLAEVSIECLPGSTLPGELVGLGYHLQDDGQGERILPHAITEQLTRTSSGALVPISPGSTAPVAEIRTHAGIVRVVRYAFNL